MDTNAILVDNKEKKIQRTRTWPPPKHKHDPKKPAETKQRLGSKAKQTLATTQHVEIGTLTVPIDDRYLDFNQEP